MKSVAVGAVPRTDGGILAIVTGGTIGMTMGPRGLLPEPGRVETALGRLVPDPLPLRIERLDPLVDSADIGHRHWNRLIDLVATFRGDGVVVTHGTDTMAHTAAALAFALAGSGTRVVLCGAMRPLGTDGAAERDLALAVAATREGPPGVHLAFGGRLLAGHALVKRHSTAPDAFVEAEGAAAWAPQQSRGRRFADRRIAILTLSPGLPAAMLRAALGELDGAVLRIYGAGSVPAGGAVVDALREAVTAGARVVAVSQCAAGGLVPGAYAAGAALWDAGVVNGGLLTPEAALAGLWLDLSKVDASRPARSD